MDKRARVDISLWPAHDFQDGIEKLGSVAYVAGEMWLVRCGWCDCLVICVGSVVPPTSSSLGQQENASKSHCGFWICKLPS